MDYDREIMRLFSSLTEAQKHELLGRLHLNLAASLRRREQLIPNTSPNFPCTPISNTEI
jgi:hypothetical protein